MKKQQCILDDFHNSKALSLKYTRSGTLRTLRLQCWSITKGASVGKRLEMETEIEKFLLSLLNYIF